MRAPYIDNKDAKLCTGCSACAYACPTGAIAMGEDACGFTYPMVDEKKCIGCGKCYQACHMAEPNDLKHNGEPKAYGAYATNKDQLMRSASGGVATAIALHVVANGGVAYGCVAHREDVRHERLVSPEDVDSSRGSKYVQSDISRAISQITTDLESGAHVAFVGTPCQCAALRRLFGKRENLLLVDLICEGVPSRRMYADFLNDLERECGERVNDFRFRDKRKGWGTKNPTVVVQGGVSAKRQRYSFGYPYYWLFQKGLILRDSCYACPYACRERVGDVTVGDYWGVESMGLGYKLEELYNGISCVLVCTSRGQSVLERLGESLKMCESSFSSIAAGNTCVNRPSRCDQKKRAEIIGEYAEKHGAGLAVSYKRNFGLEQRIWESIVACMPHSIRVIAKQTKRLLKKQSGGR